MKGYSDILAVLEYIDRKAKSPDKPKRRKNKDIDGLSEIDISLLLQHRLQENDKIVKFLKDYEKANKKEDKSDAMGVPQIAFLLMASVGPLYLIQLLSLLK